MTLRFRLRTPHASTARAGAEILTFAPGSHVVAQSVNPELGGEEVAAGTDTGTGGGHQVLAALHSGNVVGCGRRGPEARRASGNN